MSIFVGLYLVGCGLVAVAGGLKVARPHETSLAVLGLWPGLTPRLARRGVQVLAGFEMVLGAVGVAYPNPIVAGLVAASYVAFTAVVLYARVRGGPLATCGCFGSPDTPPTITHAIIDALLAVAAAGYAGAGMQASLAAVLSHQYFNGGPLLAACALCGWLAFLAMVRLPQLQAAAP